MKKIIILFLALFVAFIHPASSIKTFEINETDKINLAPKVEDPDADRLTYTFTKPLDPKGEWQTNYGDAGEYKAIITVSDGISKVSEEILIIVNRKEAIPAIGNFEPEDSFVTVEEGKGIKFMVEASDPNKDSLKYRWILNDEFVSEYNEFLFDAGYGDSGSHNIKVVVSDSIFNVSKEWSVNVDDVALDAVLEQIQDIEISETETAILDLPDFDIYGLSYSISEPLGNDNKWKTGYGDAGEYKVRITAEGKGFKGENEVRLIVKDKDRPPKLFGLRDGVIRENEELRIELEASDPDNDDIIFSAENLPENARLEGNIFLWTPSYDFVQKSNFFNFLLDKFRILSRSINIIFVAESNELSDKKNVEITVRDVNRPFILENIGDIVVNEGQQVIIQPRYNDPDDDKVSFKYSGFMETNLRNTDFDDSGEYIVKIIASDDYFTETKFVNIKVNNVNRKPEFGRIANVEAEEGGEIRIELKASDPDNDAITFSADALPEDSRLMDNLFLWKPGFDVVNGTRKEFAVDFIADDGTDASMQKVKITVLNKNRAPKILNFSNNLIAFKDAPVIFEVDALDDDGDSLAYKWDFGLFEKFDGENKHQRIFTTTGKKRVEVKVSDGIETISKVWNVEVFEV